MNLKYVRRSQAICFAILAAIKACSILFVTYMTKIMLNVTSSHSRDVIHLVRLAALTVLEQLCFMLSNFTYERVEMGIIRDISMVFKRANLQCSVDQNDPNIKNDLSFMTNGLKQIETNRVIAQLDMIYQSLTFVGSLAFTLCNSWQMTIIFMVAMAAPTVVQIFTSKIITEKSEIQAKTNASYAQSVSDSLNGAQPAKLYNVRNNTVVRAAYPVQNMENTLHNMNLAQAWALELIYSIAELFCFAIPCTVDGIMMMQGNPNVDALFVMINLAMNFVTPVVTLFNEFNRVKSTMPMWKKTQRVLSYGAIENSEKPEKFEGLDVRHLTYQTKSDKHAIFTDVNLQVKSGGKILFMAPSDWGKATLLRLMLGLKRPVKGKILVNGENVTGDWAKTYNYFSHVNQKPFMFGDTLCFNITLDRRVSGEKLKKVIHLAGLDELVKKGGLGHKIGKAGSGLSGSQIQRIEIARAFLSDQSILLADEATSVLDPNLSFTIHETSLENPHVAVIGAAHEISPKEKTIFSRIIRSSLYEGRKDQ